MKLREAQMHKTCVTVVFKNCCYLKYIKLHKVITLPLLLYDYEQVILFEGNLKFYKFGSYFETEYYINGNFVIHRSHLAVFGYSDLGG